ncbi:hypothetical protein HK102_002655 [Quaeritorhiza haematococci]|nr:hypothetical protein HK102_002655 [Quaeritorhiza haematococci]
MFPALGALRTLPPSDNTSPSIDELRTFLPDPAHPTNFDSKNPHNAARFFSSTNGKRSGGAWFYRYDARCLEVREPQTCERTVLASVTVDDLRQAAFGPPASGAATDRRQLEIVCATHARISNADFVFICCRVVYGDEDDHRAESASEQLFFFFNPFSLTIHTFLLDMDQPVTAVEISGSFGRCSAQHMLLLGLRNGKVALMYISQPRKASLKGPELRSDVTELPALGRPSRVSAISTYIPRGEASPPLIFVGRDDGSLEVIRCSLFQEGELESLGTLPGLAQTVPVTQILYRGPDSDVEKGCGILYAAQGSPVDGTRSGADRFQPSVAIYRLDPTLKQHPRFLCQHHLSEDRGKITAMTCSVDIHVVTAMQCSPRSGHEKIEIVALKTNLMDDSTKVDHRHDLTPVAVTPILDLASVGDSLECSLLYLNKMASFVGLMAPISDPVGFPNEPRFEEWFSRQPNIFPYKTKVRESIRKMRSRMDNELFFDKLLSICGVDAAASYPPDDVNKLEQLFKAIFASGLDILKKHCFIYYLLKDWKNSRASDYAAAYLLPSHFRLLVNGYWALDHGMFDEALACLCDPSVEVDWSGKVVKTLCTNNRYKDALRFVHAASPPLQTAEDVNYRMKVLLSNGHLMDAFLFQRRHNCGGPKGLDLLKRLLNACFFPPREDFINDLLKFPFNATEDAFLSSYCRSRVADEPLCADFLVMYYIAHARYVEAIKCHEEFRQIKPHPRNGANSTVEAARSLQRRSDIVANLKLLLPGVQRQALQLEMEELAKKNVEDGQVEAGRVAMPSIPSAKSIVPSVGKSVRKDEKPQQQKLTSPTPFSVSIRHERAGLTQRNLLKTLKQQMVRDEIAAVAAAPTTTNSITAAVMEDAVVKGPSGMVVDDSAAMIVEGKKAGGEENDEKVEIEDFSSAATTMSPFVLPPRTPLGYDPQESLKELSKTLTSSPKATTEVPSMEPSSEAFIITSTTTAVVSTPKPAAGAELTKTTAAGVPITSPVFRVATGASASSSTGVSVGNSGYVPPPLKNMSPFSPRKTHEFGETQGDVGPRSPTMVGSVVNPTTKAQMISSGAAATERRKRLGTPPPLGRQLQVDSPVFEKAAPKSNLRGSRVSFAPEVAEDADQERQAPIRRSTRTRHSEPVLAANIHDESQENGILQEVSGRSKTPRRRKAQSARFSAVMEESASNESAGATPYRRSLRNTPARMNRSGLTIAEDHDAENSENVAHHNVSTTGKSAAARTPGRKKLSIDPDPLDRDVSFTPLRQQQNFDSAASTPGASAAKRRSTAGGTSAAATTGTAGRTPGRTRSSRGGATSTKRVSQLGSSVGEGDQPMSLQELEVPATTARSTRRGGRSSRSVTPEIVGDDEARNKKARVDGVSASDVVAGGRRVTRRMTRAMGDLDD